MAAYPRRRLSARKKSKEKKVATLLDLTGALLVIVLEFLISMMKFFLLLLFAGLCHLLVEVAHAVWVIAGDHLMVNGIVAVLMGIWNVALWTPASGIVARLAWRLAWLPMILGGTGAVSWYLVRFIYPSYIMAFDEYEAAFVQSPQKVTIEYKAEIHGDLEASVRTFEFACVVLRASPNVPSIPDDLREFCHERIFDILLSLAFNGITSQLNEMDPMSSSSFSEELTSDQLLRTVVVLRKLPFSDDDNLWPPLASVALKFLESRSKELRMSLSQKWQYSDHMAKLKKLHGDIIDVDSCGSEDRTRKCFKKTIKALVPRVCPICGNPAERLCGGCKLIRYCSPECQHSNWSSHKLTCATLAQFWPLVRTDVPPPDPATAEAILSVVRDLLL